MNQLASVLRELKNYDESEKMSLEAINIFKNHF
jgi:hypothetical protein